MTAAVLGTVHAVPTFYWAGGGHWLVGTLGQDLVARFSDRRWLLVPVGVVKLAGAWTPVWLAGRGWPAARVWRPLCWTGCAALVCWGGLNAVVGNLVLAGVIRPAGGYDHLAMVGHAWMWDPLFLAWGIALGVGLWSSRSRHTAADPRRPGPLR